MWNVLIVPADPVRGTFQQVLTPLSIKDMNRLGGLPKQAIAGAISGPAPLAELEAVNARDGDRIDDRQFRANPAFLEFLHEMLGTRGSSVRDVAEAAKKEQNGGIAIVDLRTKHGPTGDVSAVDVIGMFRVADGKVTGYEANRAYRAYTESGLMQLSQPLAALHRKELMKLCVDGAKKGFVRTMWERILGSRQGEEF